MHGGMNGRLPKHYRLVSIEILPQECCISRLDWKIVLRIKEPWWQGGKYIERTFVGYCFEWKEITEPDRRWFSLDGRRWLNPFDKKIDILNAIVSYEAYNFIDFKSE